MKVIGLDKKEYFWQLVGAIDTRPVSAPHKRVREFLQKKWPLTPAIEELTLPGSKGLRVDFFLPRMALLIEIHGRQHFEFVSHFHGDRFGYANSLNRDIKKRNWAEINNMTLAELKEDGTESEWGTTIIEAFRAFRNKSN